MGIGILQIVAGEVRVCFDDESVKWSGRALSCFAGVEQRSKRRRTFTVLRTRNDDRDHDDEGCSIRVLLSVHAIMLVVDLDLCYQLQPPLPPAQYVGSTSVRKYIHRSVVTSTPYISFSVASLTGLQ